MTLIQQGMDNAAAIQYMRQVKLIRALCKREALAVEKYPDLELDESLKLVPNPTNPYAFPHIAPPFVPGHLSKYFKNLMIGKTPAWVVGHALSWITGPMQYSLHISTLNELKNASDHAYIIQGCLNTLCQPHIVTDNNKHHPAMPIIKFSEKPSDKNNRKKQKTNVSNLVVLFIPSTGIYYCTAYPKATPRINAWGRVMDNHTASMQNSLTQLPATSLRIRRSDGQCAKGGQLISFDSIVF